MSELDEIEVTIKIEAGQRVFVYDPNMLFVAQIAALASFVIAILSGYFYAVAGCLLGGFAIAYSLYALGAGIRSMIKLLKPTSNKD